MATQRNPINENTLIDLSETLEIIQTPYGRIANSGLFDERGITAKAHMFKILDQGVTKMTKLTSRTERDAMAVERAKEKWVTLAGVTNKVTGGVHVEDLEGVVEGVFSMESESVQEAQVKELTRMANVSMANYEYLLTTATQGRALDPYDGAVAVDTFAQTGTIPSVATITASPSADIIGSLTTLRNQLSVLNGYNGNIREIEITLGEGAFNAIVTHPDFVTLYQLAFTGMGNMALQQAPLNGNLGLQTKGQYGWSREFRWENLVFRTYPQKFYRWNGTQTSVTEDMKGWTIIHGISNLYQVKFAPASYMSKLNQVGQKWLARSTGIVDDTHIDMTIEQHLIPFMQRPEMSVAITVTTA